MSIIVPTIAGRAGSLERTIAAYEATTPAPVEFVVVHDRSCWPAACNVGAATAEGDILHFTADDLTPVDGWLAPALRALEAGELPAAHVWNHEHTPDWHDADNACDGPPGASAVFTRVPTLTRAMAKAIGPWPEIIYYGDNWVSDAARAKGWPTRLVAGYEFVHHWHQTGRLDGDPDAMERARREYLRLRALL